jgi:all-beta uncharacterized protein/PKD domain-containing protein
MTSHVTLGRIVAMMGLVAMAACSGGPDGARASRQIPTAATPAANAFVDPTAGRMTTMATASFPSPEDALAFRQVLEAKFQALGKPLLSTYVNAEGVTVWTLEYLRYRASGCSQSEAIDKVFAQIDRRGVPAACGPDSGALPPLSESLAFRQALEVKYRDDLRAPLSQTYVDPPNEVLYTQEFVRYSQSGCSGATSYERVFTQIDGRGTAPDCRPTPPTSSCSYGLSPASQSAAAAGGGFTASLAAEPSECSWQLSTDVPWITGAAASGAGPRTVNYTVAANSGAARTGRITLTGSDGTQASVQVNQAGTTTTPPPLTCTYTLSPSTVNAIPEGGTYDVQVATQTGCAWSAASSVTWATIVSGSSGVGSGTIQFVFPRNLGDERLGTAQLSFSGGSQTFFVSQAAALIRAIIIAPIECQIGGGAPPPCIFDGSTSKGQISLYTWDFGDGNTGTGAVVNHTYAFGFLPYPSLSRDATVTLTVSGPGGTSTATAIVRVFF